MKRRHFLAGTASAAVAAALPTLAMAAVARGPLLDDPESWLGAEFVLADGSRIRLEGVDRLPGDRHSMQARLQFTSVLGNAPGEGLHRLGHGLGSEELFLQRGSKGPVACLNRLRATA